jgi:2-oxoglutarate dehydrogenase E2 component (dihydrolipoamide succinyltransferase)
VQIGRWLKREGDRVERDENVVELETDKASMELPAPEAGVLAKILKQDGESVSVGDTIAEIDGGGDAPPAKSKKTKDESREKNGKQRKAKPEDRAAPATSPAVRRLLREYGLSAEDIEPTGEHGRLLKEDILRHAEEHGLKSFEAADEEEEVEEEVSPQPEPKEKSPAKKPAQASEGEEVVPMSLIRRRIAETLVAAQQQAALLTTFNEVDMSAVIALRKSHGEGFQKKYGVKLGFMAFFVKGVVDALRSFPAVNAEVRGSDVVYRNYFHIGIAIGGGKGLVVPVLRHAERLSFAEIEQAIGDFAARAQANKLSPDELMGGTFTISNGGIYGSLLSTPIVNPPQSGILGMHCIEDRPVARDGQVVIRPMMYIALTYDHRIIDGREAVTFLKRLKDTIEEPARMLIEA